MNKIYLPYAVRVYNPQGSSTNRISRRYFETREEALKLAKGNADLIEFNPKNNVWRAA